MPHNFYSWYIQNVVLFRSLMVTDLPLQVGVELTSLPANVFLSRHLLLLGIWFLLFCLSLGSKVRASREAVAVFITVAAFGVLTLTARRFVEYWAPFSVLLLAVYVRDLKRAGLVLRPEGRFGRPIARTGTVLVLLLLLLYGSLGAVRLLRQNTHPDLPGSPTGWPRTRRAGPRYFTLTGGTFPSCCYRNPRNNYQVGLDPVYFRHQRLGRWRMWRNITAGTRAGPVGDILGSFRCRWVSVDASSRVLGAQLDRDHRARKVVEAQRGVLYELSR